MLRTSRRTLERLSMRVAYFLPFHSWVVLWFFLVSYSYSAYMHTSLYLSSSLPIPLSVRLIRGMLSAWLHAKTDMYPSFITRCSFLQFLPLASLTATVQRCVPSWPNFQETIGIMELGFIYTHCAIIHIFYLVNIFTTWDFPFELKYPSLYRTA